MDLVTQLSPYQLTNPIFGNVSAAEGRIDLLLWAASRNYVLDPNSIVSLALSAGNTSYINYFIDNYYPSKVFGSYSVPHAAVASMNQSLVTYAHDYLGVRFTTNVAFRAWNMNYTGLHRQELFFKWLTKYLVDWDASDPNFLRNTLTESPFKIGRASSGVCLLIRSIFEFYHSLGLYPTRDEVFNNADLISISGFQFLIENFPEILRPDILLRLTRKKVKAFMEKWFLNPSIHTTTGIIDMIDQGDLEAIEMILAEHRSYQKIFDFKLIQSHPKFLCKLTQWPSSLPSTYSWLQTKIAMKVDLAIKIMENRPYRVYLEWLIEMRCAFPRDYKTRIETLLKQGEISQEQASGMLEEIEAARVPLVDPDSSSFFVRLFSAFKQ